MLSDAIGLQQGLATQSSARTTAPPITDAVKIDESHGGNQVDVCSAPLVDAEA